MSPISLIFLALAMSTDAFAAAVGKGATLSRPRVSDALRTGLIFGVIEAATPLVGWLLGRAASQFVTEWDHWIAFVLLVGLGLHMMYAGLRPDQDEPQEAGQKRHGFWLLAVTAFATSIDALAVGVGLAFVDVNILVAAAAIGLATMLMVTLGTLLGRAIGAVAGKRAEIAGGVVLMLVGATILYEHLSGAAA